jgi:hypothetical protein
VALDEARPVLELVARTGRRLRAAWAATGTGLTAGLLLGGIALFGGLDLLVPFGTAARAAALAVVALPAAVAAGWGILRPVVRRVPAARVARRMEARLPGIHNRLVSCVELMTAPAEAPPSPAFCRRLVRETVARTRDFQPAAVINRARLRQAAAFGGAATLLFAALWGTLPGRFPIAVARLLAPWADLPPVSSVAYAVQPGHARVLRGEDVPFTARVTRGAPERLRLELRDEDGRFIKYLLEKVNGSRWTFTLSGFERSFTYRMVGGGTWSRTYRVKVLDRPVLKELHTVLHHPAYMRIPQPVVSPPQTADVTGPLDSTVEVVAEVGGEAVQGDIQLLDPAPGAAPAPGQPLPTNLVVAAAYPMRCVSNGLWSGRFPLVRDGYYRAVFRNELGHPNKAMPPGRLLAVPDAPPLVAFDRPGTDLALSSGSKVPVVVAASDDFGLANLTLCVQRDATNAFRPSLTTNYAAPVRRDTLVASLDLSGLGLKVGDNVRYRAEVRDRKGQPAQTREFTVRIAEDPSALDRQVARYEEEQDAFLQKLLALVASQTNVQNLVTRLEARYAPAVERVEAEVERRYRMPSGAAGSTNTAAWATQGTIALPALQLDPETLKLMEALRQELGELAALQQATLQTAEQLSADLARKADQAAALPFVPVAWSDHLRFMQEAYDRLVTDPMQDLAGAAREAAAAGALPPDLGQLGSRSARLQADLADMPQHFGAVSDAAKLIGEDTALALSRMRLETLRMQGSLTARDLQELRDRIALMRAEVGNMQGWETDLMDRTPRAPAGELPALEDQQGLLEATAEPVLADTLRLQRADALRRMRQPVFPFAPVGPEGPQEYAMPREEDMPAYEFARLIGGPPPSGGPPSRPRRNRKRKISTCRHSAARRRSPTRASRPDAGPRRPTRALRSRRAAAGSGTGSARRCGSSTWPTRAWPRTRSRWRTSWASWSGPSGSRAGSTVRTPSRPSTTC